MVDISAWEEDVAEGGDEEDKMMNEVDRDLEKIKLKKLKEMLLKVSEEKRENKVRIVVPVDGDRGLDARLSGHFGRAPYFAVFELDENGRVLNQRIVPNDSEHFGGTGLPPDRILKLKPDAVITYGMGPRALSRFQAARVAVLRANSNIVRDLISAYNRDELEELTEGCHHARRPY